MAEEITGREVSFTESEVESHVAAALRNAADLAKDRPIDAGTALRAALLHGLSPAFKHLSSLLSVEIEQPSKHKRDFRFRFSEPLAESLERALDNVRRREIETSARRMWGREYIAAALLCKDDPSFQELAKEGGETVRSLQNQWFKFVTRSNTPNTLDQWVTWWTDAGVPLPPDLELDTSQQIHDAKAESLGGVESARSESASEQDNQRVRLVHLIAALAEKVRKDQIGLDPLPPSPIGTRVAAAMSEYEKPVDVLGYQTYADALGDLITHPDTQTPITIAVCGPWGSGKTTLMNYIKDRIKEVNKRSDTEFVTLDFDAWTYSKSDAIWAPFYGAVLKGIESSLGFWEKTWFRSSMRFKTERATTTGWIAVGVVSSAIFAALLYMSLANAPSTGEPKATELKQVVTVFEPSEGPDSTTILVIREPKEQPKSPLSPEDWTLEKLGGAVSSLFVLAAAFIKIFNSVSSGVLGKVKKSGKDLLPLAQEDVVRYVKNVEKWLEPRLNGGKRTRFVVFVDDIDRVEPPKIMQMMEAIQLFLRTPGFVFVLGMDARVVRQAIGEHYRFMGKAHGGSEWWGHHYLEKIIQIPFYLPKIDKKGMNSLKEKLLGSFVAPPESIEEPTPPTAPLADKERTEPRSDSGETEPEPSEAKTDSADQPIERSETPKPTPTPDATQTVDDRMVMTLTVEEDSAFDELFEDGLEMAPRLMVRLKNVYLLARHVYLRSVPESQAPPPVFTKWIALSVKYPFDAKKLVETCTNANWPDTWEEVIDHYQGQRRTISIWGQMEKDPFGDISRFLDKHIESPKQIQRFERITNCFNLVLE